ncbi:MAG: hypothetical protein KBD78_11755 [Oligoflexales bacterium]|nr:hypothetical protein [Oligoflexales bacterium]
MNGKDTGFPGISSEFKVTHALLKSSKGIIKRAMILKYIGDLNPSILRENYLLQLKSAFSLLSLRKHFFTNKSHSMFLVVMFAIFTTNCIFQKGEQESLWKNLDEVEALNCEDVAVEKSVLRMDQFRRLNSRGDRFWAQTIDRSNNVEHQIYKRKDGDLELEKAKKTFLPPSFLNLDFDSKDFENTIPVMTHTKNNQSKLEFRDTDANTISQETLLNIKINQRSKLKKSADTFYLASFDHGSIINLKNNRTFAAGSIDEVEFDFFVNSNNEIFSITRKSSDETGGEPKDQLVISRIDGKKSSEVLKLSGTKSHGIESWTAYSPTANDVYLSYFEGDSLVGTNLYLWLIKIDISGSEPKMIFESKTAIADSHVSDPILQILNNNAHIGYTQWLDNEATLSVTSLPLNNTTQAMKTMSYGVLPQGSSLLDLFEDQETNLLFSILRIHNSNSWHYRLCKIDA